MILTLRASIARFNRPILIGGTAMLGVASSTLVNEISAQSILVAVAAVCLMYVGDSGRSAEERVSAHLPTDAKPSVVRSTRVHNLNGRLVIPMTALAAVCLIATALVSLVDTTDRRESNRPALGISAPRTYRPASGPIELAVSCPDRCELHAGLIRAGQRKSLEKLQVGRGSTFVQLLHVAENSHSKPGPHLVLVNLKEAQRAPLIAKIRVVP